MAPVTKAPSTAELIDRLILAHDRKSKAESAAALEERASCPDAGLLRAARDQVELARLEGENILAELDRRFSFIGAGA